MRAAVMVTVLALGLGVPPNVAAQSRIVEASLETNLVSGPVEYAVLFPEVYSEVGDPLPLWLDLHGGGGDRSILTRVQPRYDEL